MVMINIPENLAKAIEKAAQRENRSLEDVIVSMLSSQISEQTQTAIDDEWVDPFDAIDGILDYDITDMSTTVKETMREYFRKKYGSID